ncbi:MAG TPA: DUF2933 domain-containing protein [Polyangiaceae bacterium]|nr:DUF2933 domain-containing protein [Polyangiaceae bacterium]
MNDVDSVKRRTLRWTWLGLCGLASVVAFFLVRDHASHVLQALPYVFLLLCPLMHLLHWGHGKRSDGSNAHEHS